VALARITSAPAGVLGIGGGLAVGAAADVCVFDPAAYWRVDRAALRSQGKNTPFLGLEVPGRVKWTLFEGRVVHGE
jgi:dihydroorotase